MSSVLMIFNHAPYDGTDVTWNALRLAGQLESTGHEVRIFLMNDSVDLARDSNKKPIEYDQDLSQMLRNLIAKGRAGQSLWYLHGPLRHPQAGALLRRN